MHCHALLNQNLIKFKFSKTGFCRPHTAAMGHQRDRLQSKRQLYPCDLYLAQSHFPRRPIPLPEQPKNRPLPYLAPTLCHHWFLLPQSRSERQAQCHCQTILTSIPLSTLVVETAQPLTHNADYHMASTALEHYRLWLKQIR